MIAAKPEVILENIRYWIKIRDTVAGSPMAYDYSTMAELINLVIEKLDDLQKKYRKASGDYTFYWAYSKF